MQFRNRLYRASRIKKKKITTAKPPSPKDADSAYYLCAVGAQCMPTVEEPQRQNTHPQLLSLFSYAAEIPASASYPTTQWLPQRLLRKKITSPANCPLSRLPKKPPLFSYLEFFSFLLRSH